MFCLHSKLAVILRKLLRPCCDRGKAVKSRKRCHRRDAQKISPWSNQGRKLFVLDFYHHLPEEALQLNRWCYPTPSPWICSPPGRLKLTPTVTTDRRWANVVSVCTERSSGPSFTAFHYHFFGKWCKMVSTKKGGKGSLWSMLSAAKLPMSPVGILLHRNSIVQSWRRSHLAAQMHRETDKVTRNSISNPRMSH